MPAEATDMRVLRPEVKGSCESLDLGTENQTQVLRYHSSVLSHSSSLTREPQ